MLQPSQVCTERCTMTVPVGVIAFVNVNSNKVLEVREGLGDDGARVSQGDDNGKAHQRWNVTQVPGTPGVYIFENVGSGKVLDVDSENQGAYVIQRTLSQGEPRQQWELESTRAGGVYRIKNHKTGRVVDVSSGRTDNNAPIRQYWPGNQTDGRQEWTLVAGLAEERTEVVTGPLWAWGYNAQGQLGNGQTTSSPTPVEVQGISRVRQLAVGYDYSVALLEDGTVRTWGSNGNCQLGDGTSAGATRCLPSGGPLLREVKAISAGYQHALALLEDKTMQAWGYNGNNQLGDHTTTNRLMPVAVLNLTGVTAIAAGTHHSLALLEDTTVQAWGYNGQGQLGNNTMTNSAKPVMVKNHNGESLKRVKKISAGYLYNLALLEDDSVWAWGQGNWGQLGNNRGDNLPAAVPVLDSGGKKLEGVKDISAGPYHSLALLKDNGKVLAWGHNEEGQLGNPKVTGNQSRVPVEVIDDGKVLTGVTAISAAGADDCEFSIALLKSGEVLAWGKNNYQQLGNPQGGGADPKPVVDKNGERLQGIKMIAFDNYSRHYLVASG
jgi:alpha-tubulin suppressor-like RCC1 family protein